MILCVEHNILPTVDMDKDIYGDTLSKYEYDSQENIQLIIL